jgi:hypothetical protein
MIKQVSAFTILILATVLVLKAQPYFDVLNIQGQWSKPIDSSPSDSSGIETQFLSADLSIPLKIKEDIFALGLTYSELAAQSDFLSMFRMESILFSAAFIKQWKKENIKTSFILLGRSNKDPALNFNSNSLQVGGAVLHTIQRSERVKYKFGIYYNSEFFGPFILPLAGIDWKINERMNLFGVLPGSMNLEYKLSKSVHLGIAFRSITNSFRQAHNYFIRINDNHIKVLSDFYLTKKHVLTIETGHSVLRKYKPGIRISGETNYMDLELKDGYLIKIAYAFRFRLDEK